MSGWEIIGALPFDWLPWRYKYEVDYWLKSENLCRIPWLLWYAALEEEDMLIHPYAEC
jgi:hypothetical protein